MWVAHVLVVDHVAFTMLRSPCWVVLSDLPAAACCFLTVFLAERSNTSVISLIASLSVISLIASLIACGTK